MLLTTLWKLSRSPPRNGDLCSGEPWALAHASPRPPVPPITTATLLSSLNIKPSSLRYGMSKLLGLRRSRAAPRRPKAASFQPPSGAGVHTMPHRKAWTNPSRYPPGPCSTEREGVTLISFFCPFVLVRPRTQVHLPLYPVSNPPRGVSRASFTYALSTSIPSLISLIIFLDIFRRWTAS